MGFEYRFSVTAPLRISLVELGTALQLSGRYDLLSSLDQELAFAYTAVPRRADWPEDIVLRLAETQIDALLHSGTKHQREVFIADLSDVLRGRDLRFEIEEL